MTERELRDALATAEFLRRAGRASSANTEEAHRWRWKHFDDFCARQGVEPLPCDEAVLLRYLRAHAAWSWAHARAVVGTVRRQHHQSGWPDPAGQAVRSYVTGVGLERGRVAQPLVDALRVSDLSRIVQCLHSPAPDVERAVAMLAAALVCAFMCGIRVPTTGLDPAAILSQVRIGFREGDVVLRPRGSAPVVIGSAGTDAWMWETLHRARAWIPAADGSWPEPSDFARGVNLPLAFRRAGLGPAPAILDPAQVSVADLAWACQNLDPQLARRNRDRAYLVLGVLLALRHADLVDGLTMEGCIEEAAGYRLRFGWLKTGIAPERALPHVELPGAPPHPLCPACALGAHLRSARAAGRTEGAVFATRYGGIWRPMTRQNGRLIVAGAWAAAGLPSDRRIATRSMRVGGATSAREAGWSILDIAERLTLHRCYDVAAGYVRAQAPDDFELTL